jgi:hypothetical protein
MGPVSGDAQCTRPRTVLCSVMLAATYVYVVVIRGMCYPVRNGRS